MESSKTYTVLVLLKATPQWLSLSRDKRSDFFDREILPIFRKVAQTVNIRFFDSEYFHAQVSDFMIIETADLTSYQLFTEQLRDTKIYSVPYFEINNIVLGQENAFLEFNKQFQKTAE
jgi:hypothetical protein